MADQLLATFYVQSPEFLYGNVPVTARITQQSGNNWWEDTSQLRCTVTNAHYNDENGQRRRYKIDVFRVEQSDWYDGRTVYYYPLCRVGTYRRRLEVRFNNVPTSQPPTLERMLYITIQPNLHVFTEVGGQRVDLIHTDEAVVSQNPLVKTLTVRMNNTAEATAARNIALTQSNNYKGTVFVKSNMPLDLVGNDLTDDHAGDSYTNRWVQLKDTITVTRKIRNTDYQWGGYY